MTCSSCERRIENEIRKLEGITFVKASYKIGDVTVEFDDSLCNLEKVKMAIKRSGYNVEKDKFEKILDLIILILIMVLLYRLSNIFNISSALEGQVTYLILFVIGIFTSFHCVGMCGGIMLSQTLKPQGNSRFSKFKPAILYNIGRVISYTILGGIIGTVGSVFNLNPYSKAIIMALAGVFMIIMGLNFFGIRFLRAILSPINIKKIKGSKTPFIIGLLNGIMPCGPLQAMQLYALSTGSFIKGALSMFVFSLGTIPIMLTLGILSSLINKNSSQKMFKYNGIFVMVLGFIMLSRSLSLAGININPIKYTTQNSQTLVSQIENDVQIIKMDATYRGFNPNVFIVQKGIPVKFIIDGKELTPCNNAITIPSLGIERQLIKGENIIEFTPQEEGDIVFSCWMGMLNGVIKVVDDVSSVNPSNIGIPNKFGGG